MIEAKKEGTTLTGVEVQSDRYSKGLPDNLPAWFRPLPFCYQSTGKETRFTNGFDPAPRSRNVFAFHRPEMLSFWLEDGIPMEYGLAAERQQLYSPETFFFRMGRMPHLHEEGLWPAQIEAVKNLERSLAQGRPRALIQMATGSGKTCITI